MARWQLTEPHYLNTVDTRWEFATTDRKTGRPIRKTFRVPMHLDPNIEQDWNHVEQIGTNIVDGMIVVCHKGKGNPKDIIFEGEPTPGMLPLDDEAKEISSKYDWKPTQGLDDQSQSNSFQQRLLIDMFDKMNDMKADVTAAPQIAGLDKFMETMASMMQVQTQLLAQLAGKQVDLPPAEVMSMPIVETQEEAMARIAREEGLEPIIDNEKPLPQPVKNARVRRA